MSNSKNTPKHINKQKDEISNTNISPFSDRISNTGAPPFGDRCDELTEQQRERILEPVLKRIRAGEFAARSKNADTEKKSALEDMLCAAKCHYIVIVNNGRKDDKAFYRSDGSKCS